MAMKGDVIPKFSEVLVFEALKLHFEDSKTKLTPNSTKLMSQLLTLITVEAGKRAAHQAVSERSVIVEVSHFEKVLAQLLLDL